MKVDLALKDILEVENNAEVLEPCCPDTGIPLWAVLRPLFMELVISDLLYGTPMGKDRGEANGLHKKLIRSSSILRSFAYNFVKSFSLSEFPVVLMASGARLIKQEDLYFNCLSDYFAGAAPDRTLVVEEMFDWKWPFPRFHSNLLIQTPFRVSGVIHGRLRSRNYLDLSEKLVSLIEKRAADLIEWKPTEQQRTTMISYCASATASLLHRSRAYQRIFKRTNANILIKEQACYGGADNVSAILAARNLGMCIAEYQHGAVGPGHLAYNFAPVVTKHEKFRFTLPDYFLTYGAWWTTQINVPVQSIVIGNPHRSVMLNKLPRVRQAGRTILVLGDGIETSLYIDLARRLAERLGSIYVVVFRPHPLERSRINKNFSQGNVANLRLDKNPDIYMSFQEADIVVSEVSTGLFDAIGIVPKVFIWNTSKARFNYPEHPFQGFKDPDELASLIAQGDVGFLSDEQRESIWASNWEQNYKGFLEQGH